MEALDGEREQLERGRVAPLRVLEHHQQRAAAREDREPLEQRRQHLRALALRIGRDLGAVTQTEQIGHGGDVGAGAQELLELAALDRRRVVAVEAGGMRQLRHDRLQRAALMMRQAEIAHAGRVLGFDLFEQRRDQPRLADAGLARQQHDAAVIVFGLRPAARQQIELLAAADQRHLVGCAQLLEAALHALLAQHPPGGDRPVEALERARIDRLVFEQVAGEPPRAGRDQDRVGRGGRLQARGQVRRLADDVAFLRLAAADQFADHHQAGGDADAHLMAALADLERADRLDHRQRGTHRVAGVGLVRFRIAEIDQHAVAHVFGDKAVEAGDHAGRAFVVGGDDVAQVFRIDAGRQRGRADQVAEHDGELAALGAGTGARRGRGCRRRRCGSRGCGRADFAAALRTETGTGRVLVPAGRAGNGLRRSTLRTEPAAVRNLRLTPRTRHAGHSRLLPFMRLPWPTKVERAARNYLLGPRACMTAR